jgi:hypothetical protein
MSKSCGLPPSHEYILKSKGRACGLPQRDGPPDVKRGFGALQVNLTAPELKARLAAFDKTEVVRPYVVRTVKLNGGTFKQTGSAPNFDGGIGTLCTCKHQMRSRYSVAEWTSGVWVLGFTSKGLCEPGQQTFYYLMRVRLAFESQSELVAALTAGNRLDVIAAKSSRTNEIGDLFLPKVPELRGESRFNPQNYHSPLLGHVHSQQSDPLYWHEDIRYMDRKRTAPALLLGDPEFTFVWTAPRVQRRNPANIRDYRNWTLSYLVDQIGEVN